MELFWGLFIPFYQRGILVQLWVKNNDPLLLQIITKIQARLSTMMPGHASTLNNSSSNQVLTQEEIMGLLYRFKESKTQEQVQESEQRIRLMIINTKNFTTIINMIIAKDVQMDDKVLMISTMNFVVEELLKKHENIREKIKSKAAHQELENLRRDILSISNKMEKIVDSNLVPIYLKPKIVFLLLKLYNRSKEDWDTARVNNKMEYYFRKGLFLIALSYLTNIIKLGFSVYQKLETIKKAIVHLPESGAHCFSKIAGESSLNHALNSVMSSILEEMVNLLNVEYSQVTRQIVLKWSNSQYFMKLIRAIVQGLKVADLRQSLWEWQDTLLQIMKKMSHLICFYNIKEQCGNFIMFFIQYITHLWHKFYANFDQMAPESMELILAYHNWLYINGTKMNALPTCFLSQHGNYQNEEGSHLSMEDKVYIFRNYILRVYEYFGHKLEYLIKIGSKQSLEQTLQVINELCSAKQVDPQSQNLVYSLGIWLLALTQNYKHIGYFMKNMITCLLFSENRQLLANSEWLNEQLTIITELNPKRGDNTYMGMMLCLLMYRNLVQDRTFVHQCIGKYIRMIVDSPHSAHQIIQSQDIRIGLFLILLQHYLQQIPISTMSNMRIKTYPLSPFLSALITQLPCLQLPTNLPTLYLTTIKKYFKLLKCLIQQYKQSPTYISYSRSIQFVELVEPVQEFHRMVGRVPVGYYTQLYQDIIGYQMFRIEGEDQQDTLSRVKVVIDTVIQYYQQSPIQHSQHRTLKLFQSICSCEEYVQLMATIFGQVLRIITQSKQALRQFEEDVVNLCIGVLTQPNVVAAMGLHTLGGFWRVLYAVLEAYQWVEYTTEAEIGFGEPAHRPWHIPQQSFTWKQLHLFYLASTYPIPPEVTTLIFKKSTKTVTQICSSLTLKKRKLQIAKYRPYQLQQVSFLLTLHKIIIHYCNQLTGEIVEELLQVFWGSYQFRKEFPDDFNYVAGKYNLIVVLLINYAWKPLRQVLATKKEELVHQIYFEIFYNQVNYRVEYDCPLFVVNALSILSRLWAPNCEIDKYVLKNAHFIVGGCILCLDREYQNYRCNKEDEIEIQVFKSQIKDPISQTEVQITKLIRYLTQKQPQIDQFQQMRQFFQKIRSNENTLDWFMRSMKIYIRSQVYLEYFYGVLSVYKLRRKNGIVIYRVCRTVKQEFNQEMGILANQ